MLKLIRWLLGYVFFEARGESPEKFMSLAARQGIYLWDIKKVNGVLTAFVAASEYKKLRPIARKARLRARVKKRYGFPFFLRRFKPRMGLVAGMIVFFGILYFMSLFVWQVDIKGANQIPEDQIRHSMKELGLDEGKLKSKINIRMLEQKAMQNIDNVAWLSVNIRGSVAEVSLRERIVPPEIVPKDKPCNIKAKCDAQISRTEVYDGAPEMQVGDAVFKGQLLINGVVEDVYGGCTLHHASGKIFAYTNRKIQGEIPFYQTVYNDTGKTVTRSSAKIFGANIPLTFSPKPSGEYKKEYKKERLSFFDMPLPINIYKQVFIGQEAHDIVLSEDEAREEAKQKIQKIEEESFKDAVIIDKNFLEKIEDDKYMYEVNYYCEEDIAVAEEIIVN